MNISRNLLSYILFICLLFGFGSYKAVSQTSPTVHEANKQTIPIGGNAWLIQSETPEKITKEGFVEWTHPQTVCRTYLRVNQTGKLKISVTLAANGENKLSVTVFGKTISFTTASEGIKEYFVGEWEVKEASYIFIDLKGITKTAATFGTVQSICVSGSAVNTETVFVKDNADNYFYWGRRGPSVHLKYTLPANEDIEWFYNELTIPEGQDVIGSYFMANGFAEGYFGMQVNSPTERRILFSVWSPFKTDNPKAIPDEQKIVMLKKGTDVYTGEFGNEGAGGQSYLKYHWKAGNTYKFLLQGKPTADNYTIYTAYFFAPEENQWRIIASFKRPKTSTYLKSLHSFLENFIPETGNIGRMGQYANQWVRTTSGKWLELTEAKFTGDATARKNYRKDYTGGLSSGSFYLRNCGFFNDFVPLDGIFKRSAANKTPDINFTALP